MLELCATASLTPEPGDHHEYPQRSLPGLSRRTQASWPHYFTVDLGFGVVVVRDVPAKVCDLCGTDWLEDGVAEKLEQIVEQTRLKHPGVEVANWQQETQVLPS